MSWSETLADLTQSASQAYQSYNTASSGFTPLAPGTFVGPNGQVITTNSPLGTSPTTSIVTIGVLVLVFIFAFMWLKK